MRKSVIGILLWASAGFLVSAGWGIYFSTANKAIPIGPIVYALTYITQPVVAITHYYFDLPRGIRAVAIENTATYGLIGLILATVRRRQRALPIST